VPSSLDADPESTGGTTEGGVTRDVDRTVLIGEASELDGEPGLVAEGTTLGRFVVLEQIGVGAMGRVLRGYDPKLRREVALKLVRTSSEATTERLLREAQAMAQLRHPNVVPIFDVGEHESEVFIAMEYIHGRTLRAWCAKEKPGWRAVLHVFRAAGQGLAAAHRVGLVHRDFKPDNVLVSAAYDGRGDATGYVRVMDFGLARAMDDRRSSEIGRVSKDGSVDLVSGSFSLALTQVGTVLGTPAYMAPEQHRGEGVDAKSDQYALCVALFEALWGTRPFVGESLQQLARAKELGELRTPSANGPSVPRWVRRIVVRGLASDPAARWPSVEALVSALGRDPSRVRGWWLGAALVIGAVSAAVALMGNDDELCAGASQQLEDLWNAEQRADLEKVLVSTEVSHAVETAVRVGEALDDYAAQWIEAHTDACEAARKRGEQSHAVMDARMRCLQTRRRDLSALIDTLSHADVEVVHEAVNAVLALPTIDRCADVDYVLAQVSPPDDPEVYERVEELRQQVAQARALSAAGKYAEGLQVAKRAHADALTTGYAPLVPETAYQLGVLLEDTGAYEEAAQALRTAYFEGRRTGMDEVSAQAATVLVLMLGERLARNDEAFAWSEHAEVEVARFGSESMRAHLYNQMATLHRSSGDLEQAQRFFERALSIYEAKLGPDHTQTGVSVLGLAVVHADRGDLDEAQRLHERALHINETALGPEHPANAHGLVNLGTVAWRRGNLDEAQQLYERALALNETSRGADHPLTASSLVSLANIHAVRGQLDAAQRSYARSAAIFERALGPEHPDLGQSLLGLAIVHAHRGEYEEARIVYERVIAIQEKAYGPDHLALASAVNNLANVHYELGNSSEARSLYERALAINEQAYGPEHSSVAGSLENLAWACWKSGELEEGRRLAARALALHEATLGPDHPKVGTSAIIVAEIALAHGRAAESLERLEQVLETFGARDDLPAELLADVRFTLARLLWEAPVQRGRDRPRALELAARARDGYGSVQSKPGELERIDAWIAQRRRR
jgi:eukaryotic-like serine/threonine-protein kinase